MKKQVESADRVALQFSLYVENWRRMIELKKYLMKKEKVLKEEKEHFRSILKARNSSRDKLFSSFDFLSLYYSDAVIEKVNEFRIWDEKQATKTITMLPLTSEWQNKEKAILRLLREELIR